MSKQEDEYERLFVQVDYVPVALDRQWLPRLFLLLHKGKHRREERTGHALHNLGEDWRQTSGNSQATRSVPTGRHLH